MASSQQNTTVGHTTGVHTPWRSGNKRQQSDIQQVCIPYGIRSIKGNSRTSNRCTYLVLAVMILDEHLVLTTLLPLCLQLSLNVRLLATDTLQLSNILRVDVDVVLSRLEQNASRWCQRKRLKIRLHVQALKLFTCTILEAVDILIKEWITLKEKTRQHEEIKKHIIETEIGTESDSTSHKSLLQIKKKQ